MFLTVVIMLARRIVFQALQEHLTLQCAASRKGRRVVIVYVMLDVEYPRGGLIRLETADQMLVKLLDGMKP